MVGAYGLALDGVDEAAPLLLPAPPDWPVLEIRHQRVAPEPGKPVMVVSETHAFVPLAGGGRLTMSQDPLRATFGTARRPTADEIVHPFLAPAAAVASWWLGRETFHGGAIAAGDKAWVVLGQKESGKSSLLAWFAGEGFEIVADDAVVIDVDTVFAGPRSIDLRADTAGRLAGGEHLGLVGGRERWRVRLPAPTPSLPLGGFVFLEWDDVVSVVTPEPTERLARLARGRMIRRRPPSMTRFIDFAALPARVLRRPKAWDQLGEGAARLLAELG